jgi:hypothetical protein
MNGANLQSLDKIKALRSNYNKYQSIMTQYEQQTIMGEINRASEAIFPSVATAAIGDWKAAIAKAQDAINKVSAAKVAESNRFDAGKFNAELTNIKILVDLAKGSTGSPLFGGDVNAGQRLQAIYQEAKASGDLHKQRAAAEVMQTMDFSTFVGDSKLATLSLANQAKRDLESLRTTPEMLQAEADRDQAFTSLQAQRQELIDVSQALGQQDPTLAFASGSFARALKMVQVKDGQVIFHDENSLEVTGVSWEKAIENVDATGGGS